MAQRGWSVLHLWRLYYEVVLVLETELEPISVTNSHILLSQSI